MAWDTIGSIRGPKGDTGPSSWDAIPDKPAQFPPTAHAHPDKADLDESGKVPQAQIPAVAITDYLGEVGSQSAMLGLTGQRGDWCTRTDLGTDWQLIDEPASQLASWREHAYPASPVQSVAGRTGSVTLSTGDISGLSAALAGKSDTGHKHQATDITDATSTGRGVLTGTAQQARDALSVPSRTEMGAAVDAKMQLVAALPASPVAGVLYLIPED